MARCDQGYLCDVCGDEVEDVTQSDLYLNYVIGLIPTRQLPSHPERHLRCNPVQSQFIVDPDFDPIVVEGPFDKRLLAVEDRQRQEQLVTRGWRRLQELPGLGLPIAEYPLAEFRARS